MSGVEFAASSQGQVQVSRCRTSPREPSKPTIFYRLPVPSVFDHATYVVTLCFSPPYDHNCKNVGFSFSRLMVQRTSLGSMVVTPPGIR